MGRSNPGAGKSSTEMTNDQQRQAEDERCETAYRRGVHQTLDRASRELRKRGHEDAADLLAGVAETASAWRRDDEPHELFLDELFSNNFRKFVVRENRKRRK